MRGEIAPPAATSILTMCEPLTMPPVLAVAKTTNGNLVLHSYSSRQVFMYCI